MEVLWLEREFYSGRHPISKGTCNTGVATVRKRENKQTIVLDVGRKCKKTMV